VVLAAGNLRNGRRFKCKEVTMPKRELIEPNKGDKRYVCRDDQGQFKEQADVGKSSAADQRRRSDTPSKPGYGDKGDRQKH
jgi:hypothetical protein